jgi:signal transduction histidine kinase
MSVLTHLSQNLKLSQKELLLVLIPIMGQVIFLVVLCVLLNNAEQDINQEATSRARLAEVQQLNYLFMESGRSAAIYVVTKNIALITQVDNLYQQMMDVLADLKRRTQDKSQRDILVREEQLYNRQRQLINEMRGMLERGGSEFGLLVGSDQLNELVHQVQLGTQLADGFVRIENEHLQGRPETAKKARERVIAVLIAFLIFNMTLVGLLWKYVSRTTVDRLHLLMSNMSRLTDRKPLEPPMAGLDEIAEVDRFFHKMADELEELDRLKRDFFAMVSHDLRAPLGSIKLFMGSLRTGLYGEVNQAGQERSESMDRSIQRMVSLINDLLDLEKLQQGKLDVDLAPVNLNEAVGDAVSAVQELAENRLLDIEANQTDAVVLADKGRIIQVLINLLSNAIKFSPEGANIYVTVEKHNEQAVKISVRDEGPGIPADKKHLLFERYRQLDSIGTRRKTGTGLGLPICKDLITLHHGEIGVDSVEGKGSTFWFTLPMDLS